MNTFDVKDFLITGALVVAKSSRENWTIYRDTNFTDSKLVNPQPNLCILATTQGDKALVEVLEVLEAFTERTCAFGVVHISECTTFLLARVAYQLECLTKKRHSPTLRLTDRYPRLAVFDASLLPKHRRLGIDREPRIGEFLEETGR